MRRVITIDIETLPALKVSASGALAALTASSDEDYLKTALNGDFGRIFCIGFVDEKTRFKTEHGVLGWDEQNGRFCGDERKCLLMFWERLRDFRYDTDRIVGHNIFDFDLKFILKRSVIHRVRPTVNLSFARYRNQPIFDTMHEWERWSYGSKVSLDRLAKILGFPSSKEEGIDGSKIYDLYQSGQHWVIRDYCLRDAQLTHAVYKRMVFEAYDVDMLLRQTQQTQEAAQAILTSVA